MTNIKDSILNHEEINHKIKRIAYQIYESNVNENEVILAGIDSNGFILAKKLKVLTILVKFALSRSLSEPAGLIVAQMVTRGFQLFDEGKRFSKKQ